MGLARAQPPLGPGPGDRAGWGRPRARGEYRPEVSFFLPRLKAWGSLFPDQRSNLWSPALEIQSLNHWTTRAIPPCGFGLLFPDD